MTSNHRSRVVALILATVLASLPLPACDQPDQMLMDSVTEPAGANCQYGGLKITTGFDRNGNHQLDANEVTKVTYACNQRVDGHSSLATVTTEPKGPNCANGGARIQSGVDLNDNNTLDAAEVQSTAYICAGLNNEVKLTNVPADPNGPCFFGGIRIDEGLDANANGNLDAAEITDTQYVCSVHVNENMTLVENTPELPGANCQYGGVRMRVGYDDNNDRILQAAEIDSTNYLCNQVVLISGKNSLMITKDATAAQCPFGGFVFQGGQDDNYNNILDVAEVDTTRLVCNGYDGYNTLVVPTSYSGSYCGNTGGIRYDVGLDVDYDNVLDLGEIQNTSYICNGIDGFIGYDGLNSLIVQSADTSFCPYDGLKIETGLDDDADGYLDYSEVDEIGYVCNGYNGLNSLVDISADTYMCVNGGIKVSVGLDTDEDGYLDSSEVQNYEYVCDGA